MSLSEFMQVRGEELISFRRNLHAHPELSSQETRTTAAIVPPTLSKLGVKPVFSSSAISSFDHFASPFSDCVMFGTQPLPSGSGPPAKREAR